MFLNSSMNLFNMVLFFSFFCWSFILLYYICITGELEAITLVLGIIDRFLCVEFCNLYSYWTHKDVFFLLLFLDYYNTHSFCNFLHVDLHIQHIMECFFFHILVPWATSHTIRFLYVHLVDSGYTEQNFYLSGGSIVILWFYEVLMWYISLLFSGGSTTNLMVL